MEAKIEELRGEMTNLQIELNMVRQMIGSLSRAEQQNVEMLQSQVESQTYGMIANLMPTEQHAVQQLERMKQIGMQLKQQVDHLSSVVMGNSSPYAANDMNTNGYMGTTNDPMQRQFQ